MQDNQPIELLLKRLPCASGLNEHQLAILNSCIVLQEYHQDETILAEGELSDELFAIVSGRVKLLKFDKFYREQFVLGELGAEEEFGEFAFLDGSPRSCTIKATQDTTLIIISKSRLQQFPSIGQEIIDRIILNVSTQLTKKMRSTDVSYVDILQQQIINLNNMIQFSHMFVVITVFLCLSNVFIEILSVYPMGIHLRSEWFSWSYLIILLLPCLFLVFTMHKPLSTFGITTKHAAQSLRESVVIIVIIAPALVYLCQYTPLELIRHFLTPLSLAYLVHSTIQEFIARGFIQSTISNFMFDKNNKLSIFLASFYFGIFHLHLGLQAFALTFLFGLLFGYIFYRQKNLIGVTLVHYVLGWIVLGKYV